MGAELIGGAFLSSFLNVVFERLASPEVINWLKGKKVDQKLLRKLKTSLCVVRAVLNDAEQRQISDPNVKEWLVDLQDAVYLADDLLDEVATKAAIPKVKDPGNFLSQSLNLEDQRDMVAEMEDIIERLESIVALKDVICLTETPENTLSWRVPTTSLAENPNIYGRDKDKDAIVELLLDDTNFDGEIPVISIVGIGGIGKTTLAQSVYNDDRVKGKFDSRAWVCVAEEFEIINVTKTIIEIITSCPCDINNFESLQINLKELLTGKTFLIVLDDVWSDHPNVWNNFLKPFQYGKKGSKILVTTRIETVAHVNPSIPPYHLSLLSDEACWSLFLKCSLLSTKTKEYETLEQIGRKIVEKCKGLPLAVKTLGGLLRTKSDLKYWSHVLESEIWKIQVDDNMIIIPALRISYNHLPSHLKRCFVYCSLFPQDYEFEKDELILLWMAEGFIQPMDGMTLEEVGCAFFDELVARSFFQPHCTIFRDSFVMHDLMHDLATSCAGEFYFRTEELGNGIEIGSKTRHLSCIVKGMEDFFQLTACHGAEHTRTIIARTSWKHSIKGFNIEDIHSMSHLKCSRVLSFWSIPLDILHPSIGELIHMRYLDLSHTPIVTLPESLSRLYNLQTLKLTGCRELKMLPSGMQDLVNLRHLDIRETHLQEMPKGMSKMKHLQFLSYYIAGKHEGNKIGELGALVNLHGLLYISEIENVVNGNEALKALMSNKKYVNSLCLRWSSNSIDVADSQIERDILDKLQPHQDLKELSVYGYRGTMFPDWFGYSSYKHMTYLTLHRCENCCTLPSLGQLPSLKHLWISRFDSVECIGAEFYKGDDSCCETPPFPSLQTLKFKDLKCWEEWHSFEFEDAFPQLKKLTIKKCPMLKGNLPGHLPKLEKLNIDNECKKLACLLPKTPAMLELEILFMNRLRMQELPPSIRSISIKGSELIESVFEAMRRTHPACLQSLYIQDCDSAISFPGDCVPASLQSLEIWNCKKLDFPTQQQQQHQSLQELMIYSSCDSLTSFPLSAFPNIRGLGIDNCENMESLEVSQSRDASNSSLRSLSISECPKFVSFSTLWMAAPQLESLSIDDFPEIESFGVDNGGLPPYLEKLEIRGCEKLVSNLASMDLRSYGLTCLTISGASESVKCFPKEGCLPASLESLDLQSFPSLETLDCNGLSHLTSLNTFEIWDCPKLENMTGQTLPSSLTRLNIYDCPLLGERCKVKHPQIWPMISHIRKIKVDWEQIQWH